MSRFVWFDSEVSSERRFLNVDPREMELGNESLFLPACPDDIYLRHMSQTRREFLITSTAAICSIGVGAAASGLSLEAPALPAITSQPALLEGDPYSAHVDDCGLGGRSWDAAFDHAMRFRSDPSDRDRYVLGLEL